MKDRIEEIGNDIISRLENLMDEKEIEKLKIEVLGKKGVLTEILRGMGSVPPEERPHIGQMINKVRAEIEERIAGKEEEIVALIRKRNLREERIDITMPGKTRKVGNLHPLTGVTNRLLEIFLSMGFDVVEGPDVETDYYNFEALNVPADHPARDMQDTFFLSEHLLLRSQTSGVQVRTMEKRKPPIRIVCPGRVYRADEADATHSPVFHQMEGLVVDKAITMCNLKGVLEQFAHEIYGEQSNIRFRPSFFPFTEPSVEVDVSCSACGGTGITNAGANDQDKCRICKGVGWIEILGAGMVHPSVLRKCGIDPEVYSGFAFGVGIDRLTTTSHNITDIRLLFENDRRFIEQFGE